jgi:hypothetical protein
MRHLHFLIVTAIAASAFGQGLSPTDAYVEAHHRHYEARRAELIEKLAEATAEYQPIRDAKVDRRAESLAALTVTFGEGADAVQWFEDENDAVYFRTAREKRSVTERYERLYIDPRKKELADLPLTYTDERPSMPFSGSHPGIIRWKPYVFQVIDDDEVLLRVFKDTILYFKGVATEGMVDGEYINLDGAYHSTGTTTYQTASGGSKTVRVIEPFDTSSADAIISEKHVEFLDRLTAEMKKLTAANKKETADIRESLTREFTDITGTFKVKAEYAGYASGNVRLKKENGETISVPLAKLSDTDRRWVAEQTARD